MNIRLFLLGLAPLLSSCILTYECHHGPSKVSFLSFDYYKYTDAQRAIVGNSSITLKLNDTSSTYSPQLTGDTAYGYSFWAPIDTTSELKLEFRYHDSLIYQSTFLTPEIMEHLIHFSPDSSHCPSPRTAITLDTGLTLFICLEKSGTGCD